MDIDVTVEIVPIVQNFVIHEENRLEMLRYHVKELGSSYWNKYDISASDMIQVLQDETNRLLGTGLTFKSSSTLFTKDYHDTVEPTRKIIYILEHVEKNRPQNAAIVLVKLGDIIIGSIAVIVDDRTIVDAMVDLNSSQRIVPVEREIVAFFVGIRKSKAFQYTQYYLENRRLEHPFRSLKISGFLLSGVIDYARAHGASYVATIPLDNMRRILFRYLGFSEEPFMSLCKGYKTPSDILNNFVNRVYRRI